MEPSEQRIKELENFFDKYEKDLRLEANKLYSIGEYDTIYDEEDFYQEMCLIILEYNLRLNYSAVKTASLLCGIKLKK